MNEVASEFNDKVGRVRRLMGNKGWEWVALSRNDSLAWVTGGARCFVNPGAEAGVATLLVSAERAVLITDHVEIDRLLDEEVGGLPLEFSVHDWADWYIRRTEVINGLLETESGASDMPLTGWQLAESDLLQLRFSLSEREQTRFRELARDVATALEKVARGVRRGLTERQIAENIQAELAAGDVRSPVTLVAADERVFKYRHPLPTSKKVDRYAMLVTSATRHGLYVSVTRLVHFGSPKGELKEKARACAEIDATMISATKEGTPVARIFESAVQAYSEQGHADEWKLHHQGGASGYRAREYFADAGCPFTVESGQAFAWNPSISGVKSEDTILANDVSADIVTDTGNWPQIRTNQGLDRPAILEL